MCIVPTTTAYKWWNCQVLRPANCCQHILPNRFLDGFPDPSQFAAAKLTHYSSKPQRPSDSSRSWQRILLSGDVQVPTTPACTWWNRPEEDLSSGKSESTHPSRTVVKSIEVFYTRIQDRQGTPARSASKTSLAKVPATCVQDVRIGYIQDVLVFETLRIIVKPMADLYRLYDATTATHTFTTA